MTHAPHRDSERGAALIEFALSWALMWLLFCGAFQFGYAFYVYNALKTSVSGAATLAASLSYDVGQPSTYVTAVQNMAVYGNTAGGSTPLVPSLTAANVNVAISPSTGPSCNAGASSVPCPQDVTVSITGYTINAIFSTFNMSGKPRSTVAYNGQITCSNC